MASSEGHASELALEKARIVAPLRGLRPIPAEKMVEACRAAGKLLDTPEGEVSHQTIRNWLAIIETEGPAGLDRKQHKNRGKSTLDPELEKIAKGILLNPKRFSIAETHRRLERYARHFRNLPESEIPSCKQIAYIWEHIPDEEKILAFQGIDAYRKKYDQYIRFEAPHSNAIWQADHHQLDIIVVDEETGKELGRPWITKIQDDYSRAIMGYYLSMDYPSSMGIASALHHAFLSKPQTWWVMYGLPNGMSIDNGKDWISRHIEQVCLHFGIKLQRHEPYHPASKGKIERLFRTLEEMCIHPLDGSVGSSLQKRPYRVTPRYTLAQLRVEIERFIRDYHERKHGTTKQKPRERWEQGLTMPRQVENLADIDHLLKSKQYTVQKYGIHYQNTPYLDKEGILGGYIGCRVTVFFDSRDTSRIRVWGRKNEDENLRYICTAYPQSSNEHRVNRETMGEHNKQRRDNIRKSVRDAQKNGEQVLKTIEELKAKETPSEGLQSEGTTVPVIPSSSQKPAQPKAARNALTRPVPATTTEEDELDYDMLRREFQRRQRRG